MIKLENFKQSPNLSEVALTYKTNVKPSDRVKITSSSAAYEVLRQLWSEDTIEHHEEFYLLLLNRANQVLGWTRISQGGISGTIVDVRIILQYALKTNASGIIVAHNHPSGGLTPSEQDKHATKKLKEAAKLLDVTLLDHVIITPESYYSFSDMGEV